MRSMLILYDYIPKKIKLESELQMVRLCRIQNILRRRQTIFQNQIFGFWLETHNTTRFLKILSMNLSVFSSVFELKHRHFMEKMIHLGDISSTKGGFLISRQEAAAEAPLLLHVCFEHITKMFLQRSYLLSTNKRFVQGLFYQLRPSSWR